MRANVLIQTAFLGDLLLSIPLLKRLKHLWPEHALILVCRQGVGDYFLKTKLVDEVLEVKKGDAESYKMALAKLQSRELDKVFSAHESVRTAFFVRNLKAKTKIGFCSWWNFPFYSLRQAKPLSLPDSIRQLSLLSEYDLELKKQMESYSATARPYQKDASGRLPAPPVWASMSMQDFYKGQTLAIEALFAKFGLSRKDTSKSVALFPGSVWATKRWTAEGYIGLGQQLRSEGISVLVMGGPGEELLCAQVAGQIPGAIDLCAKTSIFESALFLSEVAAVVGNDSASLHLAATSETPSVAVFGPTILEFGFRPWQGKVAIAEVQDLSCRPCGKHGHQQCPLGHHACMKQVSKDTVRSLLRSLILP